MERRKPRTFRVSCLSVLQLVLCNYSKRSESVEVFPVKTRIRQIIEAQALLHVPVNSLEDSSDLYNAGMTSHSTVVLMLALENGFGIEFPDTYLNRSVFETVDSIAVAIEGLSTKEVCS